jgi:hypothetical protein
MIILERLIHRGLLCIAIKRNFKAEISFLIRGFGALIYSSTHHCYYIEYSPEVLEKFPEVFRGFHPGIGAGWEKIADLGAFNKIIK